MTAIENRHARFLTSIRPRPDNRRRGTATGTRCHPRGRELALGGQAPME
jgi:hypothetical protein